MKKVSKSKEVYVEINGGVVRMPPKVIKKAKLIKVSKKCPHTNVVFKASTGATTHDSSNVKIGVTVTCKDCDLVLVGDVIAGRGTKKINCNNLNCKSNSDYGEGHAEKAYCCDVSIVLEKTWSGSERDYRLTCMTASDSPSKVLKSRPFTHFGWSKEHDILDKKKEVQEGPDLCLIPNSKKFED